MKKVINYFVIVLFIIAIFIAYAFSLNKKEIIDLNKRINLLNDQNDILLDEKRSREEEQNRKTLSKEINNKATKIPVLTLHRVVDHDTKVKYFKNNEWVNDSSILDSQLKYLYDNKWNSIDLNEFYDWYNKDIDVEEKTFVLTIDDGDLEAYYIVLPLLEKYNFKATLFSIGSAIPEKSEELEEPNRKKLGWDLIQKLRKEKSLLQVESHSYNLHYTKNGKEAVYLKTKKELEEDFKLNEKYNFKYMAYPYGHYSNDILEVASNSDIKLVFGFRKKDYATRLDNRYNVSRLKVNGYMNLEEFKKIFSYAK